jgi:hypothetical protein
MSSKRFVGCWSLLFLGSFLGFFLVLGFELRAYTLSHSTSPFFVMDFFEIESFKLFAQGLLQTTILPISAS